MKKQIFEFYGLIKESIRNAISKSKSETRKSRSYVIDASITGIENLRVILDTILESNSKIILTSITIRELEKLQKIKDIQGKDARYILNLAANDNNNFECVIIDETFDTPDDCIVHFCADNINNIILLTADKTMVLKARAYGIETQYYQHRSHNIDSESQNMKSTSKIYTLYVAKRIGGKLIITRFHNDFRSIRVFSGEEQHNIGSYELKIGDDVYIASKKPDYMSFAHYKVISLFAEKNCELKYSRRIYNRKDIKDMPIADYKSFMREFWNRFRDKD